MDASKVKQGKLSFKVLLIVVIAVIAFSGATFAWLTYYSDDYSRGEDIGFSELSMFVYVDDSEDEGVKTVLPAEPVLSMAYATRLHSSDHLKTSGFSSSSKTDPALFCRFRIAFELVKLYQTLPYNGIICSCTDQTCPNSHMCPTHRIENNEYIRCTDPRCDYVHLCLDDNCSGEGCDYIHVCKETGDHWQNASCNKMHFCEDGELCQDDNCGAIHVCQTCGKVHVFDTEDGVLANDTDMYVPSAFNEWFASLNRSIMLFYQGNGDVSSIEGILDDTNYYRASTNGYSESYCWNRYEDTQRKIAYYYLCEYDGSSQTNNLIRVNNLRKYVIANAISFPIKPDFVFSPTENYDVTFDLKIICQTIQADYLYYIDKKEEEDGSITTTVVEAGNDLYKVATVMNEMTYDGPVPEGGVGTEQVAASFRYRLG